VKFIVTFSEAVTGVDKDDFKLTTTGVTGASIVTVSGSGAAYTVSVNTGSKNGTIRLDGMDDDSIVDAIGNPLGGNGADNGNFAGGEIYTVVKSATFTSDGKSDGWVRESAETSNKGGDFNSVSKAFVLGDDSVNRQFKAILSFNTARLPDKANITSAVIKIKQYGSPIGANPFNVFGKLWVDIRKGVFGGAKALDKIDFQAAPTVAEAAYFYKTPVNGWYTARLNANGQENINKVGMTQFRLYFAKDDNNNRNADYVRFFSGNDTAQQPMLVITFSVP
jgi:hypothetical protein